MQAKKTVLAKVSKKSAALVNCSAVFFSLFILVFLFPTRFGQFFFFLSWRRGRSESEILEQTVYG